MKYVHDLPRKVREIPTEWIPMSDGSRLAARILLPEDAHSNPVPANLDAFEADTRVLTKTWTARVPRKWV